MRKKQGFTLMELLIVIAIIVVLVAISIPVFASNLEKSREAVDLANLRAAYAEIQNMAMLNASSTSHVEKLSNGYRTYVRCESTITKWQTTGLEKNSWGYVKVGESYVAYPDKNKPVIRIMYYTETGKTEFTRMNSSGYGANATFFN